MGRNTLGKPCKTCSVELTEENTYAKLRTYVCKPCWIKEVRERQLKKIDYWHARIEANPDKIAAHQELLEKCGCGTILRAFHHGLTRYIDEEEAYDIPT